MKPFPDANHPPTPALLTAQRLPVLQKTLRGFWVFGLVGGQKPVECLLGLFTSFRHPNLVEAFPSLLLKRIRKIVENIGRLVNPAPLMLRLGKDVFRCTPDPHGTISICKRGGGRKWTGLSRQFLSLF